MAILCVSHCSDHERIGLGILIPREIPARRDTSDGARLHHLLIKLPSRAAPCRGPAWWFDHVCVHAPNLLANLTIANKQVRLLTPNCAVHSSCNLSVWRPGVVWKVVAGVPLIILNKPPISHLTPRNLPQPFISPCQILGKLGCVGRENSRAQMLGSCLVRSGTQQSKVASPRSTCTAITSGQLEVSACNLSPPSSALSEPLVVCDKGRIETSLRNGVSMIFKPPSC